MARVATATLEAAVDSAVEQVRLYKYKPPPAIAEHLRSDYISNYLRGRHHQLLEVRLWDALPSSVFKDNVEQRVLHPYMDGFGMKSSFSREGPKKAHLKACRNQ